MLQPENCGLAVEKEFELFQKKEYFNDLIYNKLKYIFILEATYSVFR